jgi:predicted RND superfamily exporter protein
MNQIEGNNDRAVFYGRWVLRWRIPILILSVLVVLAAGRGARNLGFSDDSRLFFSEDNPQLEAFEALEDIYTKTDNILFVLASEDGDVFTRNTLAAVEDLVREAWQIPFAQRVDGLTNFQHTEADGDDLLVQDLISDAASASPEELEKARRVALSEPLLVNRLVSAEGHVTGVNVRLQFPGEAVTEKAASGQAALAAAARIQADYPGLTVRLTGDAVMSLAFSEHSQQDMETLMPLMYGAIILATLLLLRSVSGTFATVLVIGASMATVLGLTGWSGAPLTPPSSMAPTMIMTLAVADSVHILVTMLREMRLGRGKQDAIVESLRVNLQPVFLTTLTTAIGFLSMNFSDSPPFRHLGNMTAVGVVVAFILAVSTLPALMSILPVRPGRARSTGSTIMDRLGGFVVSRRRPLLWGSTVTVLALGFFVPRNELNDNFLEYFDPSVPFRQATDFTTDNLTGIYTVYFSVEAAESGGISDPAYLRKLDEFAEWYRTRPGVVQVTSLTQVMKRLNRSMHGDDPAFYSLPETRDLAAQYLLLYEMSLPYGLDLNDQINVDKSATKVSVVLKGDLTTVEVRAIADAGREWLLANAPGHMVATGAGSTVVFSHIMKRNRDKMITGTLIAFLLVSAVLVLALKSKTLGALSLLPNIVPAIMAFGFWGLMVGRVNMGLTMVVTMTIGIVVDDTVHFLSKYLRARREKGLGAQDAVRYAFSSVGTALLFTSVILIIGFAILAQSAFDLNGGMGKLTAVTIALALATDFLFLPPLLIHLDEWLAARAAKRAARRSVKGSQELNPTPA